MIDIFLKTNKIFRLLFKIYIFIFLFIVAISFTPLLHIWTTYGNNTIKRETIPICSFNSTRKTKGFNAEIDLEENSLEEIKSHLKYLSIKPGGEWEPEKCMPKFKVALIVSYRKRYHNLKLFLKYMHPFLANQNVHYKIYLVEPLPKLTFNRGLLMNVGFLEAIKESNDTWNCFIFHDVDMLPENSSNLYKCDSEMPLHLAVAVSQFNYKIDGYFAKFFGGVNAFTKEQFSNVNGFSNLYFGWGCEDDDLYTRSILKFTKVRKLSPSVGRYYSTSHQIQSENPIRNEILDKAIEYYETNGITEGLSTIQYKLIKIENHSLFKRYYVYYNQNEITQYGFKGKLTNFNHE